MEDMNGILSCLVFFAGMREKSGDPAGAIKLLGFIERQYEGFYKGDMQDSVWVYYDSTGKLAEKVLYSRDKIIKRLSK